MQTKEEPQKQSDKLIELLYFEVDAIKTEEYQQSVGKYVDELYRKFLKPKFEKNCNNASELESAIFQMQSVTGLYYFKQGILVQKLIREMLD